MAAGHHEYEIENLSPYPHDIKFEYVLYGHSTESGNDFLIFTNNHSDVTVLVFDPSWSKEFQFISGSAIEHPFSIPGRIEIFDAFKFNDANIDTRSSALLTLARDMLQEYGGRPLDMTPTEYCRKYMEMLFLEFKKNALDTVSNMGKCPHIADVAQQIQSTCSGGVSKEEVYGVLIHNLANIYYPPSIDMFAWNQQFQWYRNGQRLDHPYIYI